MKQYLKYISLVGIVLFLIILTRINLGDLYTVFTTMNLYFLGLALLVNFIAVFMKAEKWRIIVNSIKGEFSLLASVKAFLVGFSFSTITPAKLGDFIKVFYIKDDKCGWGCSLATVVIDRLIDIILLCSIAIIGIYGFALFYHIEVLSWGFTLLIVAGLAVAIYIVLNKPLLSKILRPFFNHFIPKNLKPQISEYFHEFYEGLFRFYHDHRRFLLSVGVGILSLAPPIIYGYLLARSVGITTDIFFFILVIPVICLLDLLPISISGIGTRDVALIFLFGLRGISAEQSVAFSLVYLFMSYWLVALIGAIVYLRYPVTIPEEYIS
jgi:conserved hypothetical protein